MSSNKISSMDDFAKQLRLSVDSRIQQTEYNMSKVIMPYVPSRNQNHRSDGIERHHLPSFKSPKLFNEKLFEMIEVYSKKIGKLTFIRSKITANNALEVNKIIETEEYLNWEKSYLRAFLEKDHHIGRS